MTSCVSSITRSVSPEGFLIVMPLGIRCVWADIQAPGGNLKFNNNHFPIQNFYLRKAVKDSDGSYTTKIIDTVFTNYGDNYAKDCGMKW